MNTNAQYAIKLSIGQWLQIASIVFALSALWKLCLWAKDAHYAVLILLRRLKTNNFTKIWYNIFLIQIYSVEKNSLEKFKLWLKVS